MWFLPCFFVTGVLFNALVNIDGRRAAYMISSVMCVAYIIFPMPSLFWGIDRAFKYIGFYAVGNFIAQKIIMINKVENKFKMGAIAGILIGLNFYLSYISSSTGVMWFITAVVGVVGILIFAQLVNRNKILEYLGQISLLVLCIHGPVYRILIKIVSILLDTGTDAVRGNVLLAMAVSAVTLVICSMAYEIIVRIAPWMVGKKKKTMT